MDYLKDVMYESYKSVVGLPYGIGKLIMFGFLLILFLIPVFQI